MSTAENIQKIIDELREAIPELRGILLASTEGLAVAHSFTDGADPERVAAMTSTITGLTKRISEGLQIGLLREASISGADGQVYVYAVNPTHVLAVTLAENANVGLLHLEARQTAEKIAALLS